MSTAIQNIERDKGAKAERKAILAIIRQYLKLYKGDLVLRALLDVIKERDK